MIIEVLGELAIEGKDGAAALPRSKKTRALLAYLLMTGRPHRRERLCEIFWELPDDPRGSLRWSLSKIRNVLDRPDVARVVADRERVAITVEDATAIDYLDLRRKLAERGAPLRLEELQHLARKLEAPLLDGLDLPQLHSYQSWLAAEREEVERLRIEVFQRIVHHPDIGARDAVKWSRRWRDADPHSEAAAAAMESAERAIGDTGDFSHSSASSRSAAELKLRSGRQNSPEIRGVPEQRDLLRQQTIGFCRASDGVNIAHARIGEGPPLVKAANWLNHLELDWDSPIWGKTFQRLSTGRMLIRYDERGNGLSDWDVDEISFPAFVRDLEAVVDTLELKRFPLLGMSQGCALSIHYAAHYPERVSALVLIGGYAAGWRIASTPEERERREAVMTLTRLGWGTSNPAYRHIFSQTFMPNGTPDELAWFDEFQRQTASPENAVRFQNAFGDIDVRHLLGKVQCPTLVLHARNDQRIAFENGRELAAKIAGARFLPLESNSHIILGHEPAWAVCMDEIERFLNEHVPGR
ncbi:MAG TPA: alpha/beta fold hydrolase [Mesorhizobium sp.]